MAAHWPIIGDGDVLAEVEKAVDEVSLRISAPRQAHRREGSERYTIDLVIAEEKMIFSMLDKSDRRAEITVSDAELAGLGDDQATAIAEIGRSPQLVQVLQAPAGAGKTHSLKSLRRAAHRHGKTVYVLAPTGKAVDTAIHDQAGDQGFTVTKALGMLAEETTHARPPRVGGHRRIVDDRHAGSAQAHVRCDESQRQTVARRRPIPAGPGARPRRHVRATVQRPAVDTTTRTSLADA